MTQKQCDKCPQPATVALTTGNHRIDLCGPCFDRASKRMRRAAASKRRAQRSGQTRRPSPPGANRLPF